MRDLPVELVLRIFSHLTLCSLVDARGVNRQWRELVLTSDISPARRALFDLYHEVVFSPVLPTIRSWTLAHLRYFNRRAFLNRLLDQHPYLPEEFCLWILEWPAKFAFGGVWPGLPVKERAGRVPPDAPLKDRIGTLANDAERLRG